MENKDFDSMSDAERAAAYAQIRKHLAEQPAPPAPKGLALAKMLLESDIFEPSTMRAVLRSWELAQSGTKKYARPLLKHIFAAAAQCGARREPVAALWGYLPCRFEPGWTDMTDGSDPLRIGNLFDDETHAGLLVFSITERPISQMCVRDRRTRRVSTAKT